MTDYFAPFRARRAELEQNPAFVEQVLQRGAERARAEARKTLAAARRVMGID